MKIVRWSELPRLERVAELMETAVADLVTELAGFPKDIYGIAVVDGEAVRAAALVVEIEIAQAGKRALARVCLDSTSGPEIATQLLDWFEEGARTMGAHRAEVSLRRALIAVPLLQARGYRVVDSTFRLARTGPREIPPLPADIVERTLEDAGLDAWVAVGNESFQDVPYNAPMTKAEAAALMKAPSFDPSLVRLLFDASGCIGFLRGSIAEDGTGEVDALGLIPRARGRGLGKWLLRRCEALLDAGGAREIILRASLSNASAMALYKSEGYREVRRTEVWERALR